MMTKPEKQAGGALGEKGRRERGEEGEKGGREEGRLDPKARPDAPIYALWRGGRETSLRFPSFSLSFSFFSEGERARFGCMQLGAHNLSDARSRAASSAERLMSFGPRESHAGASPRSRSLAPGLWQDGFADGPNEHPKEEHL